MKISHQGLELLIAREGKKNTVYLDSEGWPTVGVGHMDASLTVGDVWTDEQIEAALAHDILRFEKALNDNIHVQLEQHQFDALLSWLFNVGATWAEKPAHLIKLVNAGNFAAAAVEFNNWHIPASITTRRNGEREQFKGTAFEARLAA